MRLIGAFAVGSVVLFVGVVAACRPDGGDDPPAAWAHAFSGSEHIQGYVGPTQTPIGTCCLQGTDGITTPQQQGEWIASGRMHRNEDGTGRIQFQLGLRDKVTFFFETGLEGGDVTPERSDVPVDFAKDGSTPKGVIRIGATRSVSSGSTVTVYEAAEVKATGKVSVSIPDARHGADGDGVLEWSLTGDGIEIRLPGDKGSYRFRDVRVKARDPGNLPGLPGTTTPGGGALAYACLNAAKTACVEYTFTKAERLTENKNACLAKGGSIVDKCDRTGAKSCLQITTAADVAKSPGSGAVEGERTCSVVKNPPADFDAQCAKFEGTTGC